MGIYLTTIVVIFAVTCGGILVDRLYGRFAAKNPQLGPFRDTSKCGCCTAGSGCSDSSCATDELNHPVAPRR
jgi:hypothetical protein